MKFVKRMLKSGTVHAIICWLAAVLIRLVYRCNRWQTIGGEIPQKFWAEGKPFVLCFWHGRIMLMIHSWPKNVPITMLISNHQDGRLIAKAISYFGVETVVGSTGKGGARAIRALVKTLKAGKYVGLTPDGPRGPRMRSSEGAVVIARLANVPIIPVSYAVSRGKNLRSWDRFLVAWPFGRGVFIWGEPIYVDRDNLERTRTDVERSLNSLTKIADQRVGRDPIEPALLNGVGR